MKYTGYTKAQLIEWCQCLEHNYNVSEERVNRQFELLKQQQAEISRLKYLLKQCIPAAEFARDKGLADMINEALNESVE